MNKFDFQTFVSTLTPEQLGALQRLLSFAQSLTTEPQVLNRIARAEQVVQFELFVKQIAQLDPSSRPHVPGFPYPVTPPAAVRHATAVQAAASSVSGTWPGSAPRVPYPLRAGMLRNFGSRFFDSRIAEAADAEEVIVVESATADPAKREDARARRGASRAPKKQRR